MKRTAATAFLLLLSLSLDSRHPGAAQFAGDNVKLPPVEMARLENGIRLFYIKDELPQVTIVVSVGFGRLYENKENAGISELIAAAISLGGSKNYPGEALHKKIDSMGGRLNVNSSWENTVISIKVLDRFKEEAFAIAADLAARPNLDPPYLDTAKALVADSIRRKYDDPADIAFSKVREIIFDGNGYGSYPTEEKIASYTPDLVRETWKKYCAGSSVMIGVSSSLDFAETGRLCRKYFSSVAAGSGAPYDADLRKIRERVKVSGNKIFFYPKDIPQSMVIVGTVAPDIGYQGDYALEVMNYILGGGSFNSRLMTEIRVKRGLAYAVQSIVKFRHKTGLFLAFAQVENKTAGEVLGLLYKNIDMISHETISSGEIEWARRAIANSYIFQFDTPMNILSNYMAIAYNNLPADYYTTYISHINGVTGMNILAESRAMLEYGLITVVVGNESVLRDLKKHGEIVTIK
jgi:zinc protease